MLIFSLQFSLTVLICFFYVKLAPHFSIAHKWLTGLEFCIPPPENELLKVEQAPLPVNPKKKTGRLPKKEKLADTVSKKKEIELKVATIEEGTLVKHLFWEEYDELVLVAACIVINFIVSEFWSCLSHEHNTLMTAVLLMGSFLCLKILFSVIRKLGLQSYELRIVLFMGVMSFFTSFIVLEFPGNILDFNAELEKGLHEMVANLNAFLEHNNQTVRISIPIITYKLVLCAMASFMCSTIFFPSFRLARSHHEINRYIPEPYHPSISRISFFMPAFLMLLWIKPLTMDYLVPDIMSQTLFEMVRYWGIIILAALRIYLLRPYMQAFLATAVGWAELYLHDSHTKETARNIKFKILGVYSYLCVAAVQVLAPSLLLLCFAFLLKSRGLPDATLLPFCTMFDSVAGPPPPSSLHTLTLFTPLFYKGAFSFLCFWYIFSSMCIGIFAYFFERNQTIFAIKKKQQ